MSDDGGDRWRTIAGSRDTGTFVHRVMRVHADPSNPATVFGAPEGNGMMLGMDGR